jgi:hypothetical protein|tara:strand:- start:14568 stop:14795 length:228 start_codon:yes stop_codon:yes gene_type:complete
MHYETQDFRKPNNNQPPKWTEWQPARPWAYLINILAFLFIFPFLFGLVFTPFGLLMNCILIDYILYWGAMKRGEY